MASQPTPSHDPMAEHQQIPPYNPQDYAGQPVGQQAPLHQGSGLAPPPPRRHPNRYSGEQDIASPIHYTRDPKKLVAYLVPFPKPLVKDLPPEEIPPRFLIYTPPPPPFVSEVPEGQKEGRVHKVQRKWQNEIREAKTGNAKTMSWKGVKGKAIKGINWGMGQTKTSNLEFLNRIGVEQSDQKADPHAEDGKHEEEHTDATVKLEEMLLVYPSSMSSSPDQMREEFINTMLRSKSRAQRDAAIATGMLPVAAAIDTLVMFVWPFGGLLEIDAVWAYASIRGAKTSRSITKRLTSTSRPGKHDEDMLQLNFTPSPRLAILEKYLAARCHERSSKIFPPVVAPTETEVLEAVGWFPSSKGGVERNWEDEEWEISEVKEDLRSVMGKGAREWDKWCKLFEKEPEKAMKK